MYGEGISRTSELVDLGVEFGILNKSGAWFSMGDTRLGQGRDAAKQYFKDHPDIADDVQKQIMEKVGAEPCGTSYRCCADREGRKACG